MLAIYVCVGSACHLKGSFNIINRLQKLIQEKKMEEKITVKAALCLGRCTQPVSVRIDNDIFSVSKESVEDFFENTVKKYLDK